MHDVEHGACADCRFFALAFPGEQEERRLRDWGACGRPGQGVNPPPDVLQVLRDEVLNGDRHAIRRNTGLADPAPQGGEPAHTDVDASTSRGSLSYKLPPNWYMSFCRK